MNAPLPENWTSTTPERDSSNESRRLLLIAIMDAGVDCRGKWLSEAAREAIASLTTQRDSAESELDRVREQLAEIHQLWW